MAAVSSEHEKADRVRYVLHCSGRAHGSAVRVPHGVGPRRRCFRIDRKVAVGRREVSHCTGRRGTDDVASVCAILQASSHLLRAAPVFRADVDRAPDGAAAARSEVPAAGACGRGPGLRPSSLGSRVGSPPRFLPRWRAAAASNRAKCEPRLAMLLPLQRFDTSAVGPRCPMASPHLALVHE